MKTILILLTGVFLLFGCAEYKRPPSDAQLFLQGTHELRRFMVKNEYSATMQGSFFFVGGSISGEAGKSLMVTCSWKGNNGDYNITTIPYNKIRVHIDEAVTVPTIKFCWIGSKYFTSVDPNESIVYAVVTCREKDFPSAITLIPNTN